MEKYVTNIKDLVILVLTNGSEIKAKAESGDALSCFQMGMIHLLGINTPIDFKKASQYLGSQSLSDDPDANRLLGFISECEGLYSQAFISYSKASKENIPYINKVFEERSNLLGFFKRMDMPSTVLNKEVNTILNEYVKDDKPTLEAKMKIASICEDRHSCIEVAQTLLEKGEFFSAIRWLKHGNISDDDSLSKTIKGKISASMNRVDFSSTLDVIEIDGFSFLAEYYDSPSYVGIKSSCDKIATEGMKEWKSIVSSKIAVLTKEAEANIALQLKEQQEAEERALLEAQEEKQKKTDKLEKYISYAIVSIGGFVIGFSGMLKDAEHPDNPEGITGGLQVMFSFLLVMLAYNWYKKRKNKE